MFPNFLLELEVMVDKIKLKFPHFNCKEVFKLCTLQKNQQTVGMIYMEGSKIAEKGYCFEALHFKLTNHCSIFQAKVFAVMKADELTGAVGRYSGSLTMHLSLWDDHFETTRNKITSHYHAFSEPRRVLFLFVVSYTSISSRKQSLAFEDILSFLLLYCQAASTSIVVG